MTFFPSIMLGLDAELERRMEAVVQEVQPHLSSDMVSHVDNLLALNQSSQFVSAVASCAHAPELSEATEAYLNQCKSSVFQHKGALTDAEFEQAWQAQVEVPCRDVFHALFLRLLHDELADAQCKVEHQGALLSMITYLLYAQEAGDFQVRGACTWSKDACTQKIEEGHAAVVDLEQCTVRWMRHLADERAEHMFYQNMCRGFAVLAASLILVSEVLTVVLGLSLGFGLLIGATSALLGAGAVMALWYACSFEHKLGMVALKENEVLDVYGAAVHAVDRGVTDVQALKQRFFLPVKDEQAAGQVQEQKTQLKIFGV